MISIEPATRALIAKYYDKPLPMSVTAIVAVRDDEVLGIAGFYVHQSRLVMFSELSDELKCDKRAIIKAMRKLKEVALRMKLPIYAKAAELKTADVFLKHMGFVDIGQGVYEWQIH